MKLTNVGDELEGERLVAVGRKVSKPVLIVGSSAHRAQRIDVFGKPAKCFIDRPLRAL